MMADAKEYLDKRLDEWADWFSRVFDHGLGYSGKSVEAKLIEQGGLIIKTTGIKPPPTNNSAEEIEMLVSELANQNVKLAHALREQYFGRGSAKQKAKNIGASLAQFKINVNLAKQWLLGRLSVRI